MRIRFALCLAFWPFGATVHRVFVYGNFVLYVSLNHSTLYHSPCGL